MRILLILMVLLTGIVAIESEAGTIRQFTPLQVPSVPSARGTEYGHISFWNFSATKIDEKGIIVEPKAPEPIRYLEMNEVSKEARAQLAKLQSGMKLSLLKKSWVETGGFTPCQFLLPEKGVGPEYVAVRIEWRPAAMPERIFHDRKLRERWIRRHAPLPASDDVAMRISRPYLAKYVID